MKFIRKILPFILAMIMVMSLLGMNVAAVDGLWINKIQVYGVGYDGAGNEYRTTTPYSASFSGRNQLGSLTITRAQRDATYNDFLSSGLVQSDWRVVITYTVEGSSPDRIEHGYNGYWPYLIKSPLTGTRTHTYYASDEGGGLNSMPRWGGGYWYRNSAGTLLSASFQASVYLGN